MPGVLHSQVNLAGALGALERVRAAGMDTRPAFKAMRQPLRADLRAHAKAQEGPDGGKWPKRKPPRRLKARDGERRALARKRSRRVLGKLPNATGFQVERRAIVAFSKVKWARAHREGLVVGHGAKMPKRDWLWISGAMKSKAIGILHDHVRKAAK